MPSLTLTGKSLSFDWTITALSSAFNTSNYISAGVTRNTFTSTAGVASITGIISTVNAPASGSSTSVSASNVSLTPAGTYQLWAWARAANGLYYAAGTATVVIRPARPTNWAWTNTFTSGQPLNITATEWNNFCARINSFRAYKGIANYSFTTVTSGGAMTAAQANQARTAIQGIGGGAGGLIPSVATGGNINASYFITLRNELNAIT